MEKNDIKKKTEKVISSLKKAFHSVKEKLTKIKIADIIVSAGVIVLAGIIIAPSVYFCVDNHSKTICREHIYEMMWALSDELESEAETGETYFQDLIMDGNYDILLSAINKRTGEQKKFPDSDYKLTVNGDQLTISCNKHKDLSGAGMVLSANENLAAWNEMPYRYEGIVYITADGPNKYYQNESLDSSNPEKMFFSGSELNRVINNLTVTAVYEGGEKKKLDRGKYIITSEPIDMTQPGKKSLIIKTRSKSVWDNSVYTSFAFDVVGNDEVPPLIIDAGENGKYELAAWDWIDFVDEASHENGGETFGASIIRYGGEYYYYPDGLKIKNGNSNTNPFEYAYDTEKDEPAYSIKFDRNSVILKSSDGDKVHNGSVQIENGLIYIWQDSPSKELKKGWIRVYCDVRKY